MCAEQNYRKWCAAHDEAQRFHAIHAGHFQIQGDDVGLQLLNLFQGKSAVHRCANYFDTRIAGQNNRDQLPHQCGIIHNENANALAHAIAPSGFARERRERTAGTFRIRTTVPSPRMDAPLTRSLAINSPGSALMTSSSSPTIWSTRRPKRRSAAPITTTKFFFFFSGVFVSTAWMRLSVFRRTRVRI